MSRAFWIAALLASVPAQANEPELPTESTDPSDHAERIESRDWKDHMGPG